MMMKPCAAEPLLQSFQLVEKLPRSLLSNVLASYKIHILDESSSLDPSLRRSELEAVQYLLDRVVWLDWCSMSNFWIHFDALERGKKKWVTIVPKRSFSGYAPTACSALTRNDSFEFLIIMAEVELNCRFLFFKNDLMSGTKSPLFKQCEEQIRTLGPSGLQLVTTSSAEAFLRQVNELLAEPLDKCLPLAKRVISLWSQLLQHHKKHSLLDSEQWNAFADSFEAKVLEMRQSASKFPVKKPPQIFQFHSFSREAPDTPDTNGPDAPAGKELSSETVAEMITKCVTTFDEMLSRLEKGYNAERQAWHSITSVYGLTDSERKIDQLLSLEGRLHAFSGDRFEKNISSLHWQIICQRAAASYARIKGIDEETALVWLSSCLCPSSVPHDASIPTDLPPVVYAVNSPVVCQFNDKFEAAKPYTTGELDIAIIENTADMDVLFVVEVKENSAELGKAANQRDRLFSYLDKGWTSKAKLNDASFLNITVELQSHSESAGPKHLLTESNFEKVFSSPSQRDHHFIFITKIPFLLRLPSTGDMRYLIRKSFSASFAANLFDTFTQNLRRRRTQLPEGSLDAAAHKTFGSYQQYPTLPIVWALSSDKLRSLRDDLKLPSGFDQMDPLVGVTLILAATLSRGQYEVTRQAFIDFPYLLSCKGIRLTTLRPPRFPSFIQVIEALIQKGNLRSLIILDPDSSQEIPTTNS